MAVDKHVTMIGGRLRLELSPCIGGAISAFEWIEGGSSRPILRKCHTPLEKVLDAASFPLVPYVNRIREGHFRFRRREVLLQPNMAGDPSPLHGQGWLSPWRIEDSTDRRAGSVRPSRAVPRDRLLGNQGGHCCEVPPHLASPMVS